MAQLNFNARNVKPDEGIMGPIPAGWYNVMAIESELKATDSGKGKRLSMTFQVLDGQFKDRKLFFGFNLEHEKKQVQDIAWGQLSALCHAVQVLDVADSQMLHGKPLKVRVSVRPASVEKDDNGHPIPGGKQYDAQNDIKAFRNINEQVDMATATAPAGYAQPPVAPPGIQIPPQQPAQMPGQMPPQQPWAAVAPQPAAQPWQGAAPGAGAPNVPPPVQTQPQAPQQPWGAPQQPQGQPWGAQPAAAPAMPPQGAPAQPWAQQPAAQPPAMPPAQPPAAQPWAQPGTSQPWQGGNPATAVPPWQQQ